jgi:pSer/pThr/pTyr-binding forkhead associated (FHA) protein
MLEPVVQDYIRACTELDREDFCLQVGAPVLVARRVAEEQTFQTASTEMQYARKPVRGKRKRALEPMLRVLELRRDTEGSTGQMGVGRAEENDVVIQDETVSTQHALFFQDVRTGVTMLQDLESTNGTTINGNLLVPGRAVELKDKDEIFFGDAAFVFFTPGGFYDELCRMMAPMLS